MSTFKHAVIGAAVIALASSASAGILKSYTFDISGLDSDDSFGANFPTLQHDFGKPGTVVQVDWDVNYNSFSPSWASEAQIAIDTNDDLSFDADIDAGDFGAPDASGQFAFNGSIGANSISSDGLVFLTLYQSFNDGSVSPDATYGDGSWVTVYFRNDTGVVPAPSSAALFLGLGGLALRRRRA